MTIPTGVCVGGGTRGADLVGLVDEGRLGRLCRGFGGWKGGGRRLWLVETFRTVIVYYQCVLNALLVHESLIINPDGTLLSQQIFIRAPKMSPLLPLVTMSTTARETRAGEQQD